MYRQRYFACVACRAAHQADTGPSQSPWLTRGVYEAHVAFLGMTMSSGNAGSVSLAGAVTAGVEVSKLGAAEGNDSGKAEVVSASRVETHARGHAELAGERGVEASR